MNLPTRSMLLVLVVLTLAACGRRIDQQKFEPVYRAGKALQVAVEQTGGVGAAGRIC